MAPNSARSTPSDAKKRPSAAGKRPVDGPILASTKAHLVTLGVDPKAVPLAAVAMNLAKYLDDGAGLASAGVSKELRAVLAELQPEVEERDDDLDELLAPLVDP